MKRLLVVFALSVVGCSGDNNDANNVASPTDLGNDAAATSDMSSTGDVGGDAANNTQPDLPESFCSLADCSEERPQCSELLQRCVQCTANSDCGTAPLFTCETMGDGAGGEPLYECVECIDDSVCAGGTCDLATHTCM